VSHHRPAHGLADDQADPGRVWSFWAADHVQHQRRAGRTTSGPHRGGEVSAAAHAVIRREHRGQAARRARPLRRREDKMDRPARVRMRRRNPWVFARRRLLGWNVRFDTRDSGISPGLQGWGRPPPGRRNHLRYNASAGVGQTGRGIGQMWWPDARGGIPATNYRRRPLRQGGGDTPPSGRYGGSRCCGQPLDATISSR
jgi:hypothetical protein